MKNLDNATEDWLKYEAGKAYNRKLKPSYYENVSINLDFFNGNQYPGMEDADVPKPVFNIIGRLVNFFVASITSTKTVVNLSALAHFGDDEQYAQVEEAAKFVNAHINNLFDDWRMQAKIRKAVTDGATTGDFCAHIYFDTEKDPYGGAFKDKGVEGEICLELVDGSNVYLGNANNPIISVKTQPYVMIAGRDSVANLKREADGYKESKDLNITGDKDYEEQVGQGGQIEIEADKNGGDKATYIIVYKPNKNGTISVSKSVQNHYIYKDVDTGLKQYPVAWANWEEQKNQYHGKALVTGLIPNQIYINRMFAMLMYFLMNNAFPKPVYDADRISGWTTDVGVALGVHDLQPGQRVGDVATYLEYGQANPQIVQTIELAKSMTLELAGATEAALGEIRPENTSAIIAVTRQAAIPLENPKSNMREWVYDITQIMIDMMAAKYGNRPVIMDNEENGRRESSQFDFSMLNSIKLETKVQVGDGSYYSEIGKLQTLDNALDRQIITALEYLEGLESINPEYLPNIKGLIETRKEQMEAEQAMQMQQAEGQAPDYMGFLQTLPEDVQAKLSELQEEELIAELDTMMSFGA